MTKMGFILFLGGLGVSACVARNSQIKWGSASDEEGGHSGCRVHVPESVREIWSSSNDVFRRTVLANPSCSPDILAVENALLQSGCRSQGRAYVSEKGQYVNLFQGEQVPTRLVDVWECGPEVSFSERVVANKIFINNGAKGAQGPVREHYEVIVPSDDGRGFHFYVQHSDPRLDGPFLFVGNSFVQTKRKEGHPDFVVPCLRCHQSGSLLMTELHMPWANWFRFGGPMQDLDAMAANLQVPGSAPKESYIAEKLEILTLQSQMLTNESRLDALLSGEPMTFLRDGGKVRKGTLRDVLFPLFCDREIIIQSNFLDFGMQSTDPSDLGPNATLHVPRDLFVNRLLLPLQEKSGGERKIVIGGLSQAGRAADGSPLFPRESRLYFGSFNDSVDFERVRVEHDGKIWVSSAQQIFRFPPIQQRHWVQFLKQNPHLVLDVGLPADDPAKWGRFPFPVPARSFVDDDYVSKLVTRNVITNEFAAAVLLTDHKKPVLSSARCEMLQVVPEIPADQLPQAEAVTELVQSALEESSLPLAPELLENLGATEEAQLAKVDQWLTACRTSRLAEEDRMQDLYRYLRGRRAALLQKSHRLNFEPQLHGEIFFEVGQDHRKFLKAWGHEGRLSLGDDCATLAN